jgi:hypothetical protein
MTKFDGTGPQGKGPMTGKGMGFCVLKEPIDNSGQIQGFVGLQGMPVNSYSDKPSYTAAQSMCRRGCGRGFRGGRGRFNS